MGVTEKDLQEATQAVLQGMIQFAPESVVINDWTVLDTSISMSPFVIIENSDDFVSQQDTFSAQTTYTLRFWLLVALANTDWKTASDNFRDVRQAVVDTFNGGGRALGGTMDGINVRRIMQLTPIGQLFPPDIDPDITPNATPDYVTQYLGLEVEIF